MKAIACRPFHRKPSRMVNEAMPALMAAAHDQRAAEPQYQASTPEKARESRRQRGRQYAFTSRSCGITRTPAGD